MNTRLSHLLAAPEYADREKTRRARLLYTMLVTLIIISLFFPAFLYAAAVINLDDNLATDRLTLAVGWLFALGAFGLLALLHRGYLRLTATLFLLSLLVAGAVNIAHFSGIRDAAMSFFILIVMLAALLLGGRAALLFTALAAAVTFAVYWAEVGGLLVFPPAEKPNFVQWSIFALVIFLAGALLRLAVNSLNDALNRLAQSNQELQRIRAGLADRVAARTRDLELAGEIGRKLTQVRDLDSLLDDAVALIQQSFDLTRVQIYLAEPAARNLVLRANADRGGMAFVQPGMRVPLGDGSLISRSYQEQKTASAAGGGHSASLDRAWPDRSAMAVPLLSGNRPLGVLHLYDNLPDRLNNDSRPAFEALASQLAIAIENANLFTELVQARAEIEAQARRLTRTGWSTFLDAVERRAHVGYVFDGQGLKELTQPPDRSEGGQALSAVIRVAGLSLGSIWIEGSEDRRWGPADAELVADVAQRVAQQIENLRLLAEAERYRAEAEQATRRLTGEAWHGYLAESRSGIGYVYNLDQVAPYEPNGQDAADAAAVSRPLTIGGQAIGRLAADGGAVTGEEADELVAAVAQSLSAHVENLRLAGQREKALAETESLYQASTDLNVAHTYAGVLAAIRRHTTAGQGALHVAIILFDRPWTDSQRAEWLDVLAYWSERPAAEVTTRFYAAEFPSAGQVLRATAPTLIEDIATDDRLDSHFRNLYLKGFQARSAFFIPFVVGGQWIGYLNGLYSQPRQFSSEEVHRLTALAGQAAVAVQGIRLLEETNRLLSNEQRQRRNATMLVSAAGRMSGVLQEAHIRAIIVDEIYNLLLPDQISLYEWRPEQQAFQVDSRVVAAPGHDEDDYSLGRLVTADERPELWTVYNGCKPYLEVNQQPDQYLREHYCLPWLVGDQVGGVIEVFHTARGATIREEDQAVIEGLIQQAALRLLNVRLYEEAEERAAEMVAINEVARAVSEQLELPQLLETTYQQVRRIMPVDAFFVALYDPGSHAVTYPLSYDEGQRYEEGDAPEPRGNIRAVLDSGAAVLVTRTQAELNSYQQTPQTAMGNVSKPSASLAYVPLQIGRQIVGVMSAQSYEIGVYGQRELALLMGVANHVAVAIENARLFQQSAARTQELAILNEMGQALTANLDLAAVNEHVYRYTAQLMDATNFYVALYDEAEGGVSFPLAVEGGQRVAWRPRRLGQGMTEYVIHGRQALLIQQDVEGWLREHGVEAIGAVTASWLGAPLMTGNQVVGVIAVQSERPNGYGESQRDLLEAVASQAAIAIQNTRLFEQTQRQLADLTTIQETTARLTAALTFGEAVAALLPLVATAVQADSAGLYLIDGQELINVGAYPQPSATAGQRVALVRYPLTQEVVASRRALAVRGDDPRLQEHARQAFQAAGVTASATIPVAGREGILGVLTLSLRQEGRMFTVQEMNLLQTLADQSSIALERVRLLEDANRRARREQVLREITTRVRSAGDVDTILRTAAQEVGRALGRKSFVYLGHGESVELPAETEATNG